MAWSASVVKAARSDTDKRKASIAVKYTDGTLSDVRVHTVGSDADLRGQVRGALAEYEAIAAMIASPPPVGPVDLTEPVIPPTAKETAAQAWVAAYRRVQQLQRGKAIGVSAITQQTVDAAIAALNALPYDASYEALL